MKRKEHNIYLIRAIVAVFMTVALTACVGERLDINTHFGQDGRLSLKGTVSEATVATRAEAIADLQEKQLNTLDVFVEHVTGTTGDGTFINQYHLTSDILEADLNWLADNWRTEGLKMGQKYNIYVAANNTQTSGTKDLATFNVAALQALVADEVTDGIAVIDDAGNIGRNGSSTSGNIYKLYSENPGDHRALTNKKEFMMAGVIKNWTPDPANLDQVFDVKLDRAASKFVVKVNFDADFLKSLTHTKKMVDGVETWVEKPAAEQITITGTPAWKFLNFSFGAPVFEPATQGNGVEVHNSGFNIFHTDGYAGDDKNFTITTYSYPNKWEAADYANKAPSLVVSIEFTQNGVKTYHYYRIPLVKSTVTAIERNHIYSINATIATKGSAIQEDQDVTEDIQYAILPWNDKTNSEVIENDVEAVQHLYLKVNPKIYTLRGDGTQTVDINYLKASGTVVKWKLFEFNTTTETKGNAVEPTSSSAVWGWFYDKNGKMKTSYTNLTHMGVQISQSTEGTTGSKGTITVSSRALDNRAIKYILLRVYLSESPTLYEDVIIRHFPTDNIQSITGKWSSYHTGGSSREDTWDPVAAGWEPGTYQSELVPYDSYIEGVTTRVEATPTTSGAHRENYTANVTRSTFTSAITDRNTRWSANSEANAKQGSDGYWYWGTRPNSGMGSTGNANSSDYDYSRQPLIGGTQYYMLNNVNRSKYYVYYRTRYYREVTVDIPQTGNWVDWDRDAGRQGTAKQVQSDNGLFRAHVWSDDDSHVHNISSTNQNMASEGNQSGSGHTNNHMYVVQISATSDKYVLGKPILGNPGPNQSLDEVVSPAFMIASQLGVVSSGWNAASAAEHCRRYMEVGTDGTRYAGWRLPTNDEIEVINEYQRGRFGNITIPEADRVMDYVLKGHYYFNLRGNTTTITAYTGTDGTFLRCVRDLSAEEIDKLNGFDAIVQKYQAKQ